MATPTRRVTGRWRIVEMGRGWTVLGEDDTLTGHLFIHLADDSGFRATPLTRTKARGGR